MSYNQQEENMAIRMFRGKSHCGQYLQFQTWETEVGKHKLKVCLDYVVRPCLKSQNRKENLKERKEFKKKNCYANYRRHAIES